MKNLTLSAKITFGFGLLLLIAIVLGTIAVISMTSVADDSEKLAKVYVPEVEIGNNVERHSLLTMYAIRGYGLTANPTYLSEGKEQLSLVLRHLDTAKDHAQTYELPALTELEAKARRNVITYEGLVEQTVQANQRMDVVRNNLDTSAGSFMRSANTYLDNQNEAMERDIASKRPADKLRERVFKITHINNVIDLGNDTRVQNFKAQATGDMGMIEAADANFPKITNEIQLLRQYTRLEVDLAQLRAIEEAAADYQKAMRNYRNIFNELKTLGAQRDEAGSKVLEAAQETAAVAMKQTDEIAAMASSNLSTSSFTMIVGLIVAVIIGVVSAFLIIRSITLPIISAIRTIQEANAQVTTASDQIAQSATNLADGATQQASSVEEVSATIEESTAINTQNSDNAQEASTLAKGANDAAETGNVKVQDLMTSMANITEASEKIAKIIKTIDEIAFQTNLLALNAAVEAARAGEHGLGFAVVADEVKNLAQRSADAAKETATIIQQAIDQIKEGNQIAQDTNESFTDILDKANKTSGIINEIAVSIKEQAEGMSQIAEAMSNVDEITQQNAAASEEAAAASEEMNAQAVSMMESVEEVARMVGIGSTDQGGSRSSSKMLEHKKGDDD